MWGGGVNKPVDFNFITKIKQTQPIKEIENFEERQAILRGVFAVMDENIYRGKKILLVDDLYRSGSTLNEVTRTLYEKAHVNNVYVAVLTKTRVNR